MTLFEKNYFVLSPSYHGATLLAKLLNAHPEVTALGDTYPSNHFDQVCGCGRKVSQCDFWRQVKEAVGASRYLSSRAMLPLYPGDDGTMFRRIVYSDFFSHWALPSVLKMSILQSKLTEHRLNYQGFMAAVYENTNSPGKVFVDGVKSVTRVAALSAAGVCIDGVIHLYRDPGDFVVSSIKNTGRGGFVGLAEHSLRYRLYHARTRQLSKIAPFLELHYEQLAEDVDGQLHDLFCFIGVEPMTVKQLAPNFANKWHFMGNSSLFSFDGQFRVSHHKLERKAAWLIHRFAGSRPQSIERDKGLKSD